MTMLEKGLLVLSFLTITATVRASDKPSLREECKACAHELGAIHKAPLEIVNCAQTKDGARYNLKIATVDRHFLATGAKCDGQAGLVTPDNPHRVGKALTFAGGATTAAGIVVLTTNPIGWGVVAVGAVLTLFGVFA